MKTTAILVLSLVLASGSLAAGRQAAPPQKPPTTQATPPTQPAPAQNPPGQVAPPAPKPRPAKPASRMSMTVFVTDTTGAPLASVKVGADGPIVREGVTGKEGTVTFQGLKPGLYRLRFEAERFVTYEKEVALKGSSEEVEATLTRAPAPPKPAEPPPPAPKPASGSGMAMPPPDPNATVEVVSVVDWLAKNRLDRGEPRKEGIVARTPLETSALLQVRDALRDRSHADADEVIYVINGSAMLSSKGRQQMVDTGTLVVIPRGVTVTIENRGREPLWALSVLSPGTTPKP